jgi:hypothetical protein
MNLRIIAYGLRDCESSLGFPKEKSLKAHVYDYRDDILPGEDCS